MSSNRRDELVEWLRFVRRTSHVLSEYPGLLVDRAANESPASVPARGVGAIRSRLRRRWLIWPDRPRQPALILRIELVGAVACAASSDGSLAITQHDDGSLRVWDLVTGESLGGLSVAGEPAPVAFALVGAEARLVRHAGVLDRLTAHTGERLAPPIRLGQPITEAIFSPGGDQVIVRGPRAFMSAHDTCSGEELWSLEAAPNALLVACSSAPPRVVAVDGERLLIGAPEVGWKSLTVPEVTTWQGPRGGTGRWRVSFDASLAEWTRTWTESGPVMFQFQECSESGSFDMSTLLEAQRAPAHVELLEPGRRMGRSISVRGGLGAVNARADGIEVVSRMPPDEGQQTSDEVRAPAPPAAGSPVSQRPYHPAPEALEGELLAAWFSSSRQSTLYLLFDSSAQEVRYRLAGQHGEDALEGGHAQFWGFVVALSSSGQRIVANTPGIGSAPSVRSFELVHRRSYHRDWSLGERWSTGLDAEVQRLSWCRNDTRVIAILPGCVAILEATRGSVIARHQGPAEVTPSILAPPEGGLLTLRWPPGPERLIDLETGQERSRLSGRALAMSPRCERLAVAGESDVRCLDLATGEVIWTIDHTRACPFDAATFASASEQLLLVASDGTLRLVDETSGGHLGAGHEDHAAIQGASWSADGALLLLRAERAIAVRTVPHLELVCRHVFDGQGVLDAWWNPDGSIRVLLAGGGVSDLRLENAA